MKPPRVFVGSASESLDFAYALQTGLDHDAFVEVWSQSLFGPSRYALESLSTRLDNSDFAVFIFTPDDEATIRGVDHPIVRDNVLFELGMFVGRLGRDRCFLVAPRDVELRLPSDLLGLTPLLYRPDQAAVNPVAALGPACTEIRRSIKHTQSVPLPKIATVFAHVHDSPQFVALLNSARTEMIAVGPCLLYIVNHCRNHVFERAGAGVACRFLLTAMSDADTAYDRIQDYGSANPRRTELEHAHGLFQTWVQEAKREGLDIQVRVAPLVPTGMNFVDGGTEDGQLLLIPLPYRTDGPDRPCFLIEKQANPVAFKTYYERTVQLWSISSPLE